jgi:predicted nucleic acid-binding protein
VPDAVIDASAMIEFVTGAQPDERLRRRILLGQLAAPEIFDLETANVLRRLVRLGKLADADATEILADIGETPVARAPHRPLIERVWELRHCVRTYDAAYLALAENLAVPLITCDGKLAGSNGHLAKIELYPTS